MHYIKSYQNFKESIQIDISLIKIDINESLGVFYENIFKSLGYDEVPFLDTFHLTKDDYEDRMNLDLLSTNPEFIHALSSKGYKQSNLTDTNDFETFLNKPCRFILVRTIESNELETPSFILFQSWNESLSKWDDVKMFKVTSDIKNFYDKLSCKTIQVDDNGDKYTYTTTNGNEWILIEDDRENDIYKKYFRTDDFEKLINQRGVKIEII